MIFFFSDAVVRVGFDSTAYTFTEEGSGILVVQKSGPFAAPITFRVFGAGLVNVTRSFNVGADAPDMIKIMITYNMTDNNTLESDVVFIVSLEIIPPNPLIVLDISKTTVTFVNKHGRHSTVM